MTPRRKTNLLTIGSYAGAIVISLTLVGMCWSFTLKALDARIDNRIENKTQYIVELLKQMATEEQKKAAEKEMRRWGDK
jgi:cell division protein FtsX